MAKARRRNRDEAPGRELHTVVPDPKPESNASTRPVTDDGPTCWRCGRTLAAFLTRPWSLKCPRCKAPNTRPAGPTLDDVE
jgi:hypothetical protein